MLSEFPIPQIKRRVVDPDREQAALEAGLDPLLARIIAARPFLIDESPDAQLAPKLRALDAPRQLADIDKAVARLASALAQREVIGIETDHDCDGQTSHAVIYTVLVEFFQHPVTHVRSYIGHRLQEGYGLSAALTKRILADEPRPQLIITADNGSSDEEQIAQLKAQGIDVIVTDHHEIPAEGIPKSALAVINPTRKDCHYPDPCIAGCMVAWLFMAATRQYLIQQEKREIPSLAACLDFVAVGTIADCVSIARSRNNRAVVSYGMKLIAQGHRPCWRALLPTLSEPISSDDLGFKIGPLLNSDGRLSSALGSVSFLLAQDDGEAQQWVSYLKDQNQLRKTIQDKVTQLALAQAQLQYKAGKSSLCLFLEEGHAGVHGISASRIKDLFGRPVVVLCPKIEDPQLLTGSARSIDGAHLRQILEQIAILAPGVLLRYGGHQGAAGLTLYRDRLEQFALLFEQVVTAEVQRDRLGPVIWTDGELALEKINLSYIRELNNNLEPFGREFESPNFELTGNVVSLTLMGQTKVHARVGIAVDGLWFEGVWFHCRAAEHHPLPVVIGQRVCAVFTPKVQIFRGEKQLSCQVVHLQILG